MSTSFITITRGLGNSNKFCARVPIVGLQQYLMTYTDCYERTVPIEGSHADNSDVRNRVFVDLDGDAGPMSQSEFIAFKRIIQTRLISEFAEDAALMAACQYGYVKHVSSYNKLSFRIQYLRLHGTRAAVRVFVETVVVERIRTLLGDIIPVVLSKDAPDTPHVSIDLSVYDRGRKMRMWNSSKDGETRPNRVLVSTPIVNTLITYIPEDSVELPAPTRCKPTMEIVKPKQCAQRMLDYSKCNGASYIDDLCALVPDAHIRDHNDRVRFIYAVWNELPTPEGREIILKHYYRVPHKTTNEAWVDATIRSARTGGPSLGTLVFWIKAAGKQREFKTLYAKYHTKNEIPREHIADIKGTTDIRVTRYNERYVLDLRDVFRSSETETLILCSHLGTGKTMRTVELILEFNWPRILIISGRKSYSKFIVKDLDKHDLEFECYLNLVGTLADTERVIIQVESLHRLLTESKTCDPFDFVFIDESETILNQFFSPETHGVFKIQNHIVFEHVVRTAGKVLYADAFISDRTLKNAELLRVPATTKLILNECCPYSRVATELFVNRKNKKTKKIYKAPATAEFCNRICAALLDGRRVIVVWSSLTKGKAFVEHFLMPMIKDGALKESDYRFYTSESRDINPELADVNKNWAYLRLLMMTTTITVGINFDINSVNSSTYDPGLDGLKYDEIFLYGCASTALPRDIAQALMRCRELRLNRLTYVVDENVFGYPVSGFAAIRAEMDAVEESNRANAPFLCWKETPEWAKVNYIYNAQEVADKTYEYLRVLNAFLLRSGYAIRSEIVNDIECAMDLTLPEYEDIRLLSWVEVETIKRREARDLATQEELLAVRKFEFRNALTDECFAGGNSAELWTMLTKDKKWGAFWNLVNEKHQTVEEVLAAQAACQFVDMTSVICARRVVLAKVLRLLGIEGMWVGGIFEVDGLIEPLAELEDEIVRAFMRDGKTRRNTNKPFSGQNVIDLLKSIWNTWCGETVCSDAARKSFNGKRQRVFTVFIPESLIWRQIRERVTPLNRGWQGRDAKASFIKN